MRVTFSLSSQTVHALEAFAARVANGNASIVAEVALKCLLGEPLEVTQRLIERQRLDRMASTRAGWARAFWKALFDVLKYPFPDPVREKGPYRLGECHISFLPAQAGCDDDEDDSFAVYIAPTPITPDSHTPLQLEFERSSSPVSAAEVVAAKLIELGVHFGALKRLSRSAKNREAL